MVAYALMMRPAQEIRKKGAMIKNAIVCVRSTLCRGTHHARTERKMREGAVVVNRRACAPCTFVCNKWADAIYERTPRKGMAPCVR